MCHPGIFARNCGLSPEADKSVMGRKGSRVDETGHAVGLKHPDTCPTNSAGLRPLMCADTYKDLRTRRYSPYEATALRRLVLNRAYYPPA